MILSGQPYKVIGAPPSLVRGDVASYTREFTASQAAKNGKNSELITLALSTLGSFDFSGRPSTALRYQPDPRLGHVLNEFVRGAGLPYLDDDNPEVRRAAALACCRVFVKDPICYQASSHAIEIISDVLDKLLTVGIADPGMTFASVSNEALSIPTEPSIRQTVLSSLHERFDKHLAQAENVRSIFIALNDEVFENRVTAVSLIGRLAKHNPAYVMPSLRKALIQLLTELEYSTIMYESYHEFPYCSITSFDRRNREECTRLLTLLVSATQRLIKPYALPILRVLIAKANDPNPTVAANVLMCLGELAAIGGEAVAPHITELLQAIIAKLQDPAHIKRDAALRTLGQLCSSTGYVITPLVEYPQLLQILHRILRTESGSSRRDIVREVVKVLGILGALDPYRRKVCNCRSDE